MAKARGSFAGRGYVERANVITGASLNSNGQTTFSREFPMGEGWYKLHLRINAAVTIGTGAGAVTESELLAVKNVLLKTDRGEILCNLPGRALFKMAVYKTGQVPRKDAMAAATATYRVNLPLFFADEAMNRPEDTILDTSRYRSVSLQIQMGGVSDYFTAPGTATVVHTLDVEIERSLGVLPANAKPFFHSSFDYRAPVDANSITYIDLERSPDMSLKRLYVHESASGTAGVPWGGTNADDVKDYITIKDQNRFIEKERKHEMIQDQNKNDAHLESVLAGVEVFDFVRDGAITSALSTGDKSVLQYTWVNKAGVAANDIVTAAHEAIRTLK